MFIANRKGRSTARVTHDTYRPLLAYAYPQTLAAQPSHQTTGDWLWESLPTICFCRVPRNHLFGRCVVATGMEIGTYRGGPGFPLGNDGGPPCFGSSYRRRPLAVAYRDTSNTRRSL